MLKNILELSGVSALNNEKQKEVTGGNPILLSCSYRCNGRNYVLVGGQGPECYLNYPAIIVNHPSCGGSGGGIDVWA